MLATRSCDTEHSPWHFQVGKYYPSSGKTSTSPRMSDQYEHSLPTQPDWQGQYHYLPQTTGSVFSQSSEQNHVSAEVAHPHPVAEGEHLRLETDAERPTTLPPSKNHGLGAREVDHSPRILEPSERKEDVRGAKTTDLVLDESLPSIDTSGMPVASNQLNSASSTGQSSENSSGRYGPDDQAMALKDDADDVVIDEEMGEGDPEAGTQPLTTAERVAARRKMKRFRLTHQQTRFLTSEFAKQPHPDAAHRERLSKEIPGLSPRQVQVWFQNRRAKMKRISVDDRDRMIKMRAVPDDFDNVQALHSPYGAVHGLGMPLVPPVDFTSPSYANPMMRPLMVDIRRQDGGDQISPTGLTPSLSGIGFNPPGAITAPGVLSPISPNSNDRYHHGSHPSTALGGGHGSLDSAMQAHRQGMRPPQPFHLREPMIRPRSDSLQSPLRSSMSWKTDSMDYYMYQGVNANSNVAERSPLVFPPSHMGQATSSGIGGLDRGSYSSSNTQSPTGMSYSAFQHTQNRSRHRAASASLPLSFDQYRTTNSGMHSPTQTNNHRATGPPSPYGAPSAYSTSYPPAPLTAPLETSQPRPPNTLANVREYPDSQISLPAVSTNEFPQTLQAGLNNQDSRTEVRDMFHSGSVDYSHSQERHDSYGDDLGTTGSFKREGPNGSDK